jgi:hypothetical protein
MSGIDQPSNNRATENGQSDDDGLSPLNSTDEIIRRGQHAMERMRRGFDDWMDIAEALQVGRVEAMLAAQTNEPRGKRYDKIIGDWLFAKSFHLIDKGTRKRLLECLQHRAAIEKWRGTLTVGGRLRFNHPDTVLRKWKAATVVPDPNKPKKPSPIAKLKESVRRLDEENHRLRKEVDVGGGDLWSKDDKAEDIAEIMLVKLTTSKAERVARAILAKAKEKKKAVSELKTGAMPWREPVQAAE